MLYVQDEDDIIQVKHLEELVVSDPDDPSHHFNLVILYSFIFVVFNLWVQFKFRQSSSNCWKIVMLEHGVWFYCSVFGLLTGEIVVEKRRSMEGKGSRTVLNGSKIESSKWGSFQVFRPLLQLCLRGYPESSQMLPTGCRSQSRLFSFWGLSSFLFIPIFCYLNAGSIYFPPMETKDHFID